MAFWSFSPAGRRTGIPAIFFSYFGVAGMMYRAIKAGQEDVREPYRKLIENFCLLSGWTNAAGTKQIPF